MCVYLQICIRAYFSIWDGTTLPIAWWIDFPSTSTMHRRIRLKWLSLILVCVCVFFCMMNLMFACINESAFQPMCIVIISNCTVCACVYIYRTQSMHFKRIWTYTTYLVLSAFQTAHMFQLHRFNLNLTNHKSQSKNALKNGTEREKKQQKNSSQQQKYHKIEKRAWDSCCQCILQQWMLC